MSTPTTESGPELVIVRTLRAPRALVWQAWADPTRMVKWMGPHNFPARHHENDFCPGGAWRSCLAAIDGSEELWVGGTYRELVEPERLVFTFAWDGDDGRPENEMLVRIELAEQGDHTVMTLRQTRFVSTDQRDRHNGGWTACFERLDEYLAAKEA
jgi:uncharacterized protein YndB with AHSA1/START domain